MGLILQYCLNIRVYRVKKVRSHTKALRSLYKARAELSFHPMKQLRILLLPHGQDTSPLATILLSVPIYKPTEERDAGD